MNLRVLERDDIDFLAECFNDLDFWGEYNNPVFGQISKSGLMRDFDNPPNMAILIEWKKFIIDRSKSVASLFLAKEGRDMEQKRLS